MEYFEVQSITGSGRKVGIHCKQSEPIVSLLDSLAKGYGLKHWAFMKRGIHWTETLEGSLMELSKCWPSSLVNT